MLVALVWSYLSGGSYRGIWISSKVFEITTLDWPGSGPPRVGPLGEHTALIEAKYLLVTKTIRIFTSAFDQ